MKLNLRQQLSRLLVAAGLLPCSWAWSADLRTNLVQNPSFEDVDSEDLGPFDSVRLFDWADFDEDEDDPYAYPYSAGYSGFPQPPGSDEFHFTGGFGTTLNQATISQRIRVDSGESGALIASGEATYDLSAFFSTFREQNEASSVRVRFLNGEDELGANQVGGANFVSGLPIAAGQRFWGQDAKTGTIPSATTTVAIEIVADGAAANFDGYVDQVDFRVGGLPLDESLLLRVDSAGIASLANLTGESVELNYYEISSLAGSLDASSWNSLQDQDFEGGGAPGVGNGWEEAGGVGPTVLSESYLLDSSSLLDGVEWPLGRLFRSGGEQDLRFRYGLSNGLLLHGVVQYLEGEEIFGDTNQDGSLGASDIDFLYLNLGAAPSPQLDLNGDAVVDQLDVDLLVEDILNIKYGDSTLNGVFDSSDFVATFQIGEYEDAVPLNSTWVDGDWNGDRDFSSSDLVFVFQKGDFVTESTAAVPEPGGWKCLLFSVFGLLSLRRQS